MSSSVSAQVPLATERLSDRLAGLLQGRIERGELKPLDRLPTEADLASAHGVSRTVVREAVSQLKSTGLLVSRQGSGVFVAPVSAKRALAFDPRVLDSLEAVVQVVEVRRALDAEAAALAAQRASAAAVRRIEVALAAIDAAVAAGDDGVDEDLGFHRAISAAAANTHLSRVLAFLEQYQRDAMQVTRANESRSAAAMAQVLAEHREIVAAIKARDPDRARAAATNHMVQAARRIEQADASVRRDLKKALAPGRKPRPDRTVR